MIRIFKILILLTLNCLIISCDLKNKNNSESILLKEDNNLNSIEKNEQAKILYFE